MNLSDDTSEIMNFLDMATNSSLRKRNDIGTILELSATYNEIDNFWDLLFHCTSFWNIHLTLKRNIDKSDDISKLKIELSKEAEEIRRILTKIIGYESKQINERFQKTYIIESSGTFANLLDLSHDMAQVRKLVVNMAKSNKFANDDNSSESSK